MEKTNRWTDKQVKQLKTHYGHMELMEISHMLGKTPSAITSKVHYLRTSKNSAEKYMATTCQTLYEKNSQASKL